MESASASASNRSSLDRIVLALSISNETRKARTFELMCLFYSLTPGDINQCAIPHCDGDCWFKVPYDRGPSDVYHIEVYTNKHCQVSKTQFCKLY